jgi:hypothetical protein
VTGCDRLATESKGIEARVERPSRCVGVRSRPLGDRDRRLSALTGELNQATPISLAINAG